MKQRYLPLAAFILVWLVWLGTSIFLASAERAVPEPESVAKPVSVMTVSRCAKPVALIFVGEDGTLHPLDVSHRSLDDVLKLLVPFPNDPAHALGVVIPCDEI